MNKNVLRLLKMSVLIVILAASLTSCKDESSEKETLNVRLQWFPHAQFAGYLLADSLGYYDEAGLNVTILPGGPDIKPPVTVANGSDDIGIGVSNQIIAAQSNGVPLVSIAQMFQTSPNRYVLKKKNAIQSLKDLQSKKVGLWMGGDEAEFVSMLGTAGMKLSDVEVVNQGYTVVPFLEDQMVLSQVTTYYELQQILQSIPEDSLQILNPADYNSSIPADNIFTTEQMIQENPEVLEKFLEASFRGWQYAMEHPEEALNIILSYNEELDRSEQELVLREVLKLINSGKAGEQGIGYIDPQAYENVKRILKESGQLENDVDVKKAYNSSIWEMVPVELRKF